jgi:hypothetical protein
MKWKLEKRKLSELHERKDNPRKLSKHDAEHLRRSIEEFGICQPIVATVDGEIIGGHQRFQALRKMGHKEVDVYLPLSPLSEEKARELCIRLNKNNGDWDFDALANGWDPESLVDWGFTMDELHLESIPDLDPDKEGTSAPKKATITIKFEDADHLQEAENQIATIVDAYEGAVYKVKVK